MPPLGGSPRPVLVVTEGLLDQSARVGPPFHKTCFTACLFLDHQRVCFIQITRHRDQQSHAGQGDPRAATTVFMKADALVRRLGCVFVQQAGPQGWGALGRDWPEASTKHSGAGPPTGGLRGFCRPSRVPCPLFWEAEKLATLLGLANMPFSQVSRHRNWVEELTETFFEYLLSADTVQVFHTFLFKLYFELLKSRASENLSQVTELMRIKLCEVKGRSWLGHHSTSSVPPRRGSALLQRHH